VALQLQRLGTRAVVAEALVAEADKVDRAVRHLVTAAADGDLAAAKALIPWLNQVLGMPTERVEHRLPARLEELDAMDEAQLERLVATGRGRRLRAVPLATSQSSSPDMTRGSWATSRASRSTSARSATRNPS
jgi:hypothetical protein